MITIKLQGGLGNQLFQIFTTIATAIANNDTFFFVYSDKLAERFTYWNSFLEPLRQYTVITPPYGLPLYTFMEEGFHYTPIPHLLDDAKHKTEVVMLDGYFQSHKYFEKHKSTIYEIVEIPRQLEELMVELPEWVPTSCSVHFRLGDYKEKTQFHTVLPVTYYVNSIHQLLLREPTTIHMFIFNEREDHDIVDRMYLTHMRITFPQLIFHRISYDTPDWKQLLIMSLCGHNIIANSSFSWFGAYIGCHYNNNKKVFYPATNWFGPKLAYKNTSDLYVPGWCGVNIHVPFNGENTM
jgi:hypothetical protein